MKIVIAPDSFKGSLTAAEAADCIECGLKSVLDCETIKIPMADGGEGTIDAVTSILKGELITVNVKNPLLEDVTATYGIAGDTAIIEMSAASGITLIPKEKLDPMLTSTFGTGQLIMDAISRKCRKIIIGIGGSATNDAGAGMAAALGVKFKDANGNEVIPCGGNLDKICDIDTSCMAKEVSETEFLVACDVKNPLYGPDGAAFVFAPQKGASKETVKTLDDNLKCFAMRIKECLGVDVSDLPGSGAAGGLGAGLYAFCNAALKSGFDIISETVSFDKLIEGADYVITGEGCTDFQTAFGKLPCGVGLAAKAQGIPCIIISGRVKGDVTSLYGNGISAVFSASDDSVPLDDAIKNADVYLEAAARCAAKHIVDLKDNA